MQGASSTRWAGRNSLPVLRNASTSKIRARFLREPFTSTERALQEPLREHLCPAQHFLEGAVCRILTESLRKISCKDLLAKSARKISGQDLLANPNAKGANIFKEHSAKWLVACLDPWGPHQTHSPAQSLLEPKHVE